MRSESAHPDAAALASLRKTLHRHAEIAGREHQTRDLIIRFLAGQHPTRIVDEFGSTGVAAVYEGREPGPTLMFRAELDAIEVAEANRVAYRSLDARVSHTCGHDGHMTILAGLARMLHRRPLKRGRVVLLFQPAEETGSGAEQIINDGAFRPIEPDRVFALHNLPGFQRRSVIVKAGLFSCASTGLRIQLLGRSAHASQPQAALNPTQTMCAIITRIDQMLPAKRDSAGDSLLTITHARLGKPSFGITPGEAEILVTARSSRDAGVEALLSRIEEMVRQTAAADQLGCQFVTHEKFLESVNDAGAVAAIRQAAETLQLPVVERKEPFEWSEDFGRFTARYPGAMFGLGSGTATAPLHSPQYNFPDELIDTGRAIFWQIIHQHSLY